jgi:hypothetical protein
VVEVGRGWGRTEKSAAELVAAMLSLALLVGDVAALVCLFEKKLHGFYRYALAAPKVWSSVVTTSTPRSGWVEAVGNFRSSGLFDPRQDVQW